MISIAICDDDIYVSEDICQKVEIFAKQADISVNLEVFGDGRDIVDDIVNGSRYDIIFMDIEMRYMNGMVAAQKIREIDKTALLIYVTNHSQYAIEAYKVQPFRFLVKPYDEKMLRQYFLTALKEILREDLYFRYSVNKKSYKVRLQDILYFESQGRVAFIVSEFGIRKFNAKLNSIENMLADSKSEFWRVHQSYLVNRKHVYNIGYSDVEMSNGAVLSISEERRKVIREKYFDKIGAGIIE
jgi:Response regulator of the LytR/AlgR family